MQFCLKFESLKISAKLQRFCSSPNVLKHKVLTGRLANAIHQNMREPRRKCVTGQSVALQLSPLHTCEASRKQQQKLSVVDSRLCAPLLSLCVHYVYACHLFSDVSREGEGACYPTPQHCNFEEVTTMSIVHQCHLSVCPSYPIQ